MNNEPSTVKRERLWLLAFFGFVLFMTGLTVYFLWTFSTVDELVVAKNSGGKPLPPLTVLFFEYRTGFLLLPLPWLAYAVYRLVRGKASPRQLIAFSSSLIFTLAAVSMVAALAFSMPWMEVIASTGTYYRLTPEQLVHTLYAAERQDAAANFRLFQYYRFASPQRELSDYYLDKAAALGHPKAPGFLEARERTRVAVEKQAGR